jgi:glycosyltransferase involved in cell wall biosynthesis
MKKIKVAQVITRLDWGGSPDIVRIICSYLNPELYDIRLITGQTKYPSRRTKEFLEKFATKVTVITQLKREINPINDLWALIKLYLIFRQEKFDIIHTHTAKAGVLGRVAAYLAGNSVIIHTAHGHNFYGYFGPFLSKVIIVIERFIAKFTDRIIVLTELERKDLLRHKVADDEKIILIYQGLELDKYTSLDIDKIKIKESFNIKPNENMVGMIARLEPIKGPRYFIEAAREVLRDFAQTKFILVGDGSLRNRLEKRIKDLELKDKFIFTGWREDMPELLSILDILVLPSLNEAAGMVLIEAQVSGVPVIATNVGGIPEIVQDNQTGVLVSARDYQSLAQAINHLLSDKQKRLNLAEAAKIWVRGRFKAEDMIDKISRLYQEMISVKK